MDLLLYIFALLPLVQAWTFRYTNSSNETTTIHGTKNLDCTDIDLPNENAVSWDPEETLKACLLIYHRAECPDSEYSPSDFNTSCTDYKWEASAYGRFRGIRVLVSGAPTATASISTATQTTATTGTSTSPSTSSNSSSGLTLSGGAIAGIVVGLVCAFLIVAAIFFFLGRRKRKAKLANQHNAPQDPYETIATGNAKADVLTSAKGMSEKEKPADSHPTGVGPAPGSHLAELAGSGQNRPAELATNSVHELDAHN